MPRNIQKVKFLTDFKRNFSNFNDFWRISEFKRPGKKVLRVALEKPGGNISQNMTKTPISLKLNATLRPF